MPEIGKSQGTQTSGEEGGKEQEDVSICQSASTDVWKDKLFSLMYLAPSFLTRTVVGTI